MNDNASKGALPDNTISSNINELGLVKMQAPKNSKPKPAKTQNKGKAPNNSNENTNIHVAITTSNNSDLSQAELDSIQTMIEEMYVNSYNDRHDNYPIFVGKPEIITGIIRFVCKNEFTKEWLQKKIRDMKINCAPEKLPLKLVLQKDLPNKLVKCQFNLNKNLIPENKLLSTLHHMDLNRDFSIDKWTIYKTNKTDSGGLCVEVGIPNDLLPKIMKIGPLMIGFDPVKLNVINEKDSIQATTPSPRINSEEAGPSGSGKPNKSKERLDKVEVLESDEPSGLGDTDSKKQSPIQSTSSNEPITDRDNACESQTTPDECRNIDPLTTLCQFSRGQTSFPEFVSQLAENAYGTTEQLLVLAILSSLSDPLTNRDKNLLSSSTNSYEKEYSDSSSISCESDTELESIPTASNFKQHPKKNEKSKKVGQSSLNKNKITRKSFGENGYIEGQWKNSHLIELYSCQFTHPLNNKIVHIRKQIPGYLLNFEQENFTARVSFNKIEEMDFAGHSIDIKRNFLKRLKISKIIEDELLNDRDQAYEQFKQLLLHRSGNTANNLEYAEDIFQLSKKIEDRRKVFSNLMILEDIVKNKNISHHIKNSVQQLLDRERALDVRKKEFSELAHFNTIDLQTGLQQICKCGIDNHRNTVNDKYFYSISNMPDHLSRLNDKSIFYISNKDMELFADLVDMMEKQPFLDFIGNLWDGLFLNVEKIIQHESIGLFAPLTNPIYFYLCKSFVELISEISSKTDITIHDLLHKDNQGKFSVMKKINWLSSSPLNISLEHQYRFVFKLMEHFKPGYYSSKRSFKYEFKILHNSDDKTLWQSIKSLFVSSDKLSVIPEERLVWFYMLDNTIANVFSKEELKLFEPLLKGYTNFIIETKGELYESFRIVTYNTARFMTQTRPYISKEVSKIDQDILTKQIESIKKAFLERQSDDFRYLVDVYNEYWEKRQSILEKITDKFPYGKFKNNMEIICQKLLYITSIALDKKAKSQGFIKYFRSFNDFSEDLNTLEFIWFIKKDDIKNQFTEVELVNADKNSYKVVNPENFIKNCQEVPNHYIIEITHDILNSVSNLLRQNKWSDDDNLNATSELLSAIKKSFLYFKDQSNYVSFDTFRNESTKPFISVVDNSSSFEDFKKRIGIIGKSFWYLRKQNEIDIEKALALYSKENNNSTNEILKSCYSRYLNQFESYIQETSDKNYQDMIKFIIEKVKKQSEKIKINEWTSKFKRETLPELLAGLAAVWSIQESKDIACTGKSLKPHCIQVLCIFRLLSIDKDSKGVDKHLAQVLTGQGKSLVLGFLSSLLALTGHKVRTVCYSEYLATRDQQDFYSFFKQFGVDDKISYGSFEDMANEVLSPEINGSQQGLRELVESRILNHNTEQSGQIKQKDISNTTLLIDEVDVFFSDQFYGNIYGACNTISIPGLASIQEKIYEMASKSYEKNTILKELEEFTNKKIGDRNQSFKELNKFLCKPGKYFLLKEEDNVIIKKEYSNRSLYQEHLEKMIDNAISVVKGSDKYWYINRYKINDNGIISCKKNGVYSISSFIDYYNVFNYFRLKKKEFDNKNYKNYGYLKINCGRVSYTKLPIEYPLILGVSGTLTTLNDHEKKVVRKYYNISENSIMPSFFGDSHLKFNSSENFTSQNLVEEWLSKIFSHANSKISSGQSVLIFFDTDVEINQFKEKFYGKFDRLHILTENTDKLEKEKYIDEAGVSKTITLATRGMGRGVDFKSSVSVENSGGVHVIQTFFSLDIKEETQIKGRTARKDNKGSYELILCKEHLINAGFLKDNDTPVDYQTLNTSRKFKIEEKGSNDEERIEKAESDHSITMNFLESFFKKDSSTTLVEPPEKIQQNI